MSITRAALLSPVSPKIWDPLAIPTILSLLRIRFIMLNGSYPHNPYYHALTRWDDLCCVISNSFRPGMMSSSPIYPTFLACVCSSGLSAIAFVSIV